jgi:hypothetical protein
MDTYDCAKAFLVLILQVLLNLIGCAISITEVVLQL